MIRKNDCIANEAVYDSENIIIVLNGLRKSDFAADYIYIYNYFLPMTAKRSTVRGTRTFLRDKVSANLG